MMRRNATHAWIAAVVLTLHLAAGCGTRGAAPRGVQPAAGSSADGRGLVPVSLQLNWYPEAEHGGFYAALAHGYYREAGLDVTIVPGGPETPVVQQVARGAATFGVVNADNVLFARAQEAPIVALMAPLQISPRCLIVHESSGIREFGDLKNMTIAMSNASAFTHFLQRALPLEGVKIVPYSGNVAQFLVDPDFAQQGYVFSEPFVVRKAGGNPRVLMVADLGFNPYTSLLFTSDTVVENQAELVRKMVTASVRGWTRYLESPEETNRAIHRVNPEMELDILAFGAEALRPLVLDDEARQRGIGTMSRERWQTLANQLIEIGRLKSERAQVDEAFTTRFLPASPSHD
jgi:NitT/TauT family transport system substrate-binding protein